MQDFFSFFYTVTAVDVKQPYLGDDGRLAASQLIQDRLVAQVLVDLGGDVAAHQREFGDLGVCRQVPRRLLPRTRVRRGRPEPGRSYFCCQRGCSSPIQPACAPPHSMHALLPGCSAGWGCGSEERRARTEQRLHVRFHVVEIDAVAGRSPTARGRRRRRQVRPRGSAADTRRPAPRGNSARSRTIAPAPAGGSR